MEDAAKKDLFLSKMNTMKTQQLTNILKCTICRGLFRFAHTIVDCSHTFCQSCIFTYIKSFKGRNPTVKCPQCHEQIDCNYSKSIMRDIFKQNLVDMLQPSYLKQEEIIIKRMNELFPEEDLQFLLDQFKQKNCNFYVNLLFVDIKKFKKVSEKNVIMGKLVHKIKQKLNITFQKFSEEISKPQRFEHFLSIIKSSNKKQLFIELKAKSGRQQKFIGVNNKIKTQELTIKKIKRFIQKKALQKINTIQDKQQKLKFFNKQKKRFIFQIQLWNGNQKLIEQNQGISFKLQNLKGPVYYVLLN